MGVGVAWVWGTTKCELGGGGKCSCRGPSALSDRKQVHSKRRRYNNENQESIAPTAGNVARTYGGFLGHGNGLEVQNLDLAFKSVPLSLDSGTGGYIEHKNQHLPRTLQ